MKSISAIHPAITESTENTLMKRVPKRFFNYWKAHKPVRFMFCPLHSNIGKEQQEKHLCNPSSHYGKYGEYTRETRAPYLDT